MSAERWETLIVGGGVAGLATAWHLARRGCGRVLLVERNAQLGAESSGKNAAILRTFGADPILNEVSARGAHFLREPPDGFAPFPLVDPCGLLLVAGADDAPSMIGSFRAASATSPGGAHRSDARLLDADEVSRLAPHYGAPVAAALWFPSDGRIDIAGLVEGFARGARAGGVEIRCGVAVAELLGDGSRVRGVRLSDGGELVATTTVIAAGAWAGRLGRAAGSQLELTPTRRHLLVTAADARIEPRWPVVWSLGDELYCRPESAGMLLCGCDQTEVDPDRCEVDANVRELIAEKTARLLPDLAEAGAASFWCGMRTFTGDGRFAIGPDPDVEGLHWVAGLGGAGMGCGPEVGRIAAARLCGELADEGDEVGARVASALDPARLASYSSAR